MRVAVVLPMGTPSEVVGTARFAEETGFDGVWMYENLYAAGAFAAAGAAITATSRIRVGIGTVSPYTRSPAIVAMEAGLLHRLGGGRFALGLGASPAELVGRLGIDATKPLTVMRETLTVLRELFAGRSTTFAGERVRLRDVTLALPQPAEGPPLYLGAIGERMLGLAGQLADGLIFSVLCPLPFIRRALGYVAAGAAAAQRDATQFDVVAYVPFALRAQAREARDLLRPEIAFNLARFAGKPDLERLLTQDGLLDAARMQWIARRVGEGAAPSEVIDDDLVDALCLAGDEDDVRRRLDAYGKAGVREIALFGVGTDAQSREMLKTLARIAR